MVGSILFANINSRTYIQPPILLKYAIVVKICYMNILHFWLICPKFDKVNKLKQNLIDFGDDNWLKYTFFLYCLLFIIEAVEVSQRNRRKWEEIETTSSSWVTWNVTGDLWCIHFALKNSSQKVKLIRH